MAWTLTPAERRRLASARRQLKEASAKIDAVLASGQGRSHNLGDASYYAATSALVRAAVAVDAAAHTLEDLEV